MNGLDVALAALLIVAGLLGLATGIVRLALGLLSLIVGAVVAVALADRAGAQAARWIHAPELALLVGFVAVFAGVLLAFTLVAWLLRKALAKLGIGFVDRALGALLGAGAVVALGGLAAAPLAARLAHEPLVRSSRSLPWLAEVGRSELAQVPPDARAQLRRFVDTLRGRLAEVTASPAEREKGAAAAAATPGASPSPSPRGKGKRAGGKGRATPAAAASPAPARTPTPATTPGAGAR